MCILDIIKTIICITLCLLAVYLFVMRVFISTYCDIPQLDFFFKIVINFKLVYVQNSRVGWCAVMTVVGGLEGDSHHHCDSLQGSGGKLLPAILGTFPCCEVSSVSTQMKLKTYTRSIPFVTSLSQAVLDCFVCFSWLLNVPATGLCMSATDLLNVPSTCLCISATDLLRQFYVLPHSERSCKSNFLPHPVTVYLHQADQSQR